MPATPRILVFQHIACEHPGIFRDFLREDGIAWDAVELDEGEAIPDLRAYDALWVMGGPMDVWQEAEHSWLRAEKDAIRAAVEVHKKPYLGFCLGHQLLAAALGGEAGPAGEPEIGILEIAMTPAGRASPFLAGIEPTRRCLQWHSAEVHREPAGATVLASSPACRVQAMAIGEHAFSMQYHVELTPTTVSDWGDIPEYRSALDRALGPGALDAMVAEAARHMPAFNRDSRMIYENFMRATGLKPAQRNPQVEHRLCT
jgi:GMP synthase-like glutamine amidotransferase